MFIVSLGAPYFCHPLAMREHLSITWEFHVTTRKAIQNVSEKYYSRPAKWGGFKTGGFPDLDLSFLFCPFLSFPDFSGIFPICSGTLRGFSRFVLFLFLGLLTAPTRNSPERVRDTIWTFSEKSGKHPGLEPPRFSFSQIKPLSSCLKLCHRIKIHRNRGATRCAFLEREA